VIQEPMDLSQLSEGKIVVEEIEIK